MFLGLSADRSRLGSRLVGCEAIRAGRWSACRHHILYVCQVIMGEERPSHSDTIFTSTPAKSASVTYVWRRSCKPIFGTTSQNGGRARRRSNSRENGSGLYARPSAKQNTSPWSG